MRKVNAEHAIDEYLRNGAVTDSIATPVLRIAQERQAIYRRLLDKPIRPFRGLLLALLEQEVQFRKALWDGKATDDADYYEGIYRCAFLLYRAGDPRDIFPLWNAKHTDMDVGCSLGAEYFVGAGLAESKAFLKMSAHAEAKEIRHHIDAWFDNPEALGWQQAWENERSENIRRS